MPTKVSKGQLNWLQKYDPDLLIFITRELPIFHKKWREILENLKKFPVPLTFREAKRFEEKGVNFADPKDVELIAKKIRKSASSQSK